MKKTMRLGDIVLTPVVTGDPYGSLPAIVIEKATYGITVHTGTARLVYEADQLRPHGTIGLGRAYGVASGKRFRACLYTDGSATREIHVCTRPGGTLGEETRALEIRKLAFAALLAERRRAAAEGRS